jgi:Cft2 family RNA processing exonuclease
MKYTAVIREMVCRDIRVVIDADSKGQAKRIASLMATHTSRYKNGLVADTKTEATVLLDTIEELTPETNDRIQKELRK